MKPFRRLLYKSFTGLAIAGLAFTTQDTLAQRNDRAGRRDGGRSQSYSRPSPGYRSGRTIRTYSNTRIYSSPRHNYYPSRSNGYYRSYSYARPRSGVSLNISLGNRYRSWGGFYYGNGYHYYPSYYRSYITPRFGIRYNVLPVGYYSFYSGGYPYYFSNGSYYRRYNDYYETVAPPLGARVPELPSGAQSVLVNGQEYYEYQGTYYQKEYNDRGEALYSVIGTDGVLETDKPAQQQFREYQQQNSGSATRISQLPEGSRTVTLDGKTYFITPAGDYYQQVTDSNDNTYYELSGSESDNR